MAKLGAVFPGMTFAHFIHTDERILATAGRAGAAMIWNPLSNGRLASGLPDIPAYQEHGIRIGMGLDAQATADIADPFENMRMGMYALRMQHHSARAMTPSDVLYLHTLSTADVLGVADRVGSLEPGKLADFLIVDPRRPSTGPLFDATATLVLACSAANIESVWVAGERRVERGRITTPDYQAVIADVERRVAAIKRRLAAA
jgi:cytosine/adenosine deaminase-related metal-dependent hydrolase